MPVKIRLTRMGKKKQPTYRVVVVDSRRPRDGAYIEQIGRYDPRQEPSLVEIDNERAVDWLRKGAQPTDRARKLLEISGAWTRFRIHKGDIHTITETAPAPTAPEEVAEPPVEDAAAEPVAEEAAAWPSEEEAAPMSIPEVDAAEAASSVEDAAPVQEAPAVEDVVTAPAAVEEGLIDEVDSAAEAAEDEEETS